MRSAGSCSATASQEDARSSSDLLSLCCKGRPRVPGQEFVDPIDRMLGDALEHVAQIRTARGAAVGSESQIASRSLSWLHKAAACCTTYPNCVPRTSHRAGRSIGVCEQIVR